MRRWKAINFSKVWTGASGQFQFSIHLCRWSKIFLKLCNFQRQPGAICLLVINVHFKPEQGFWAQWSSLEFRLLVLARDDIDLGVSIVTQACTLLDKWYLTAVRGVANVESSISRFFAFVEHWVMYHAGAGWRVDQELSYFMYIVPEGTELRDLTAPGNGASFD